MKELLLAIWELFMLLLSFGVCIWLGWKVGHQYGEYVGWTVFFVLSAVERAARGIEGMKPSRSGK